MSVQLGFADHLVSGTRSRRRDWLGEMEGLVDWAAVAALLKPLPRGEVGRPPYPVLVLFRALLLQRWYDRSDEGLADALADRLSFRRFAGLALEDAVPDASTLCRFRVDLARAGLADAVFAGVGAGLDARGLVVRRGTLIDASLLPAAAAEPPRQRGGETSAVDPEARWARQGATAVFGYKLHIAVDHGSGLVRAARVTPAAVADCTVGPELVRGDEGAVHADKPVPSDAAGGVEGGYDSARMRDRLAATGVADQVMRRANKHHALDAAAHARNRAIGRVRGRVEGVFGTLKRSYRRHRLRSMGLARNHLDLLLTLVAMNLRRARLLTSG